MNRFEARKAGYGVLVALAVILAFATSCNSSSDEKVEEKSSPSYPAPQPEISEGKEPINSSGSRWRSGQISAYNPFGLVNSNECPILPGLFFSKTDKGCETYLPGSENSKTINKQPVFRYSLPIKFSESGEPVFKSDPSLQSSCNSNIKIRVLVADLAGKRQVEVVAGSAEVSVPESANILSDNVVCRVRVYTPST
jgi:hypothetical protein